MNNKYAIDLINNHKGLLLGSRAFEVHNKDSDWDVAILASNLPKEYMNDQKFNITNYFVVLPLGNAWLIRRDKLDILVFEDEKDFNSIYEATWELKSFPKHFLVQKHMRITLFEMSLKHFGFRDSRDMPNPDSDFDEDIPF